jgi:hypothetical protein
MTESIFSPTCLQETFNAGLMIAWCLLEHAKVGLLIPYTLVS